MSSASDSQNQSMSFGDVSLVSSFSSSSVSTSPPPSPRQTSKTTIPIKLLLSGAFSTSQRPSWSKPTKAIITLPSKTTQQPKTTPKPKPKTPSKPRQRPSSSTAAKKPYTKPAPPLFIPNITQVGATHDPIPVYLHNAPSPAVRPPPPLSIQPLATIYSIEVDASSQPSRSPIIISSSGSPHTPSGTPPITPPRPSSDSPASEHNLEELAKLARRDEQEVFGAILASLNQGQKEEQVMRSDPPNASLELDEVERYAMMLKAEL
ncbi:proline-rich receptor-like protein kinase PERK2 [Benincasa hispida]|uniref:proline-rich receptor-like protein kinase PERK2 n=1 Tax=Benincasa hispida TaxID=102211 RepID=UPI0018FFC1CF|nr:proline-rich receptor-like protein kinase PERK2 [Benincasa hispida]